MKRLVPIRSALLLIALSGGIAAAAGDDDLTITPDVVYGHKDGMALTFDVLKPEEQNGAGVLFMVSGGWYSKWREPERTAGQFGDLLDEGFTLFLVRHGSAPRYTVPEAIADVRRAVRFVRQDAKRFGVDPGRLGVCGGSAGGHLSLVLGTTGDDGNPKSLDPLGRESSRVAAVVAYYPPTYLKPWTKPESRYYKQFPALRFDSKLAEACSPLSQVTADDAPALLIHGDADELVPIDHSQKIQAAFEKAGVESRLLVIPGAAHGYRGADAEKARQARLEWFEKHLVGAK